MPVLLFLLDWLLGVDVEKLLSCCWRVENDVNKEFNKALSLVTEEEKCDRVALVDFDRSSTAEAALL